jgi:hypothetical protein
MVLLEQDNHALHDTVATQLQTQHQTNRLLMMIAGELQSLNKDQRRATSIQGGIAAKCPWSLESNSKAANYWHNLHDTVATQLETQHQTNWLLMMIAGELQSLNNNQRRATSVQGGSAATCPWQPSFGTTCLSSWTTCLTQA